MVAAAADGLGLADGSGGTHRAHHVAKPVLQCGIRLGKASQRHRLQRGFKIGLEGGDGFFTTCGTLG